MCACLCVLGGGVKWEKGGGRAVLFKLKNEAMFIILLHNKKKLELKVLLTAI